MVTWKSHVLANGALAMTLTNRPLVAGAAMLTAAVPDQLERWLPFARHRGLSHWLLLWAAGFFVVWTATAHGARPMTFGYAVAALSPHQEKFVREAALGLALGPLLHVLMDGCSRHGVPVGPFVPVKLRLGLYRTAETRRVSLDPTEVLFTAALLALCALAWRLAWAHRGFYG